MSRENVLPTDRMHSRTQYYHELKIHKITNSKSIRSRIAETRAEMCAPDWPYMHSRTQYYHELKIHTITNSKSIHNRIAEARASASTGARGTAAKIVGNRLFAFCMCRVCAYWSHTNIEHLQSRAREAPVQRLSGTDCLHSARVEYLRVSICSFANIEHLQTRAREATLQRLSVTLPCILHA